MLKDIKTRLMTFVKKLESLLGDVVTPQVQSGDPQIGDQWSAFKPQGNLAPIMLDTGSYEMFRIIRNIHYCWLQGVCA